jgi:hypothetical protein
VREAGGRSSRLLHRLERQVLASVGVGPPAIDGWRPTVPGTTLASATAPGRGLLPPEAAIGGLWVETPIWMELRAGGSHRNRPAASAATMRS